VSAAERKWITSWIILLQSYSSHRFQQQFHYQGKMPNKQEEPGAKKHNRYSMASWMVVGIALGAAQNHTSKRK